MDVTNCAEIDLKYVLDSLARIWTTFDRSALRKPWQNVGLNTWDSLPVKETMSPEELRRVSDKLALAADSALISQWLRVDGSELGYGLLSDDEIIKKVTSEPIRELSDYDENLDDGTGNENDVDEDDSSRRHRRSNTQLNESTKTEAKTDFNSIDKPTAKRESTYLKFMIFTIHSFQDVCTMFCLKLFFFR